MKTVNPENGIEDRSFNGSSNYLELLQRMKLKYNCVFNVKKFPFDSQNCVFIMKINQLRPDSLSFAKIGDIFYNGSTPVDQFSIGTMSSIIVNTNESTKYIITLPLSRISTSSLLNVFIPTVVLWLFGYSTLFIDPEHHIDRFMGSGTALLVMTTLLNAVNSGLPNTSYMKYIDLWFVWHVTSVFCIICYNITLGRLVTYFKKPQASGVKAILEMSYRPEEHLQKSKSEGKEKTHNFNKVFMIIFPLINALFYITYFFISILCNFG